MSDHSITSIPPGTPLAADDPKRALTVALPEDRGVRHIFLAGDVYSIVVSGNQTDGRYCLIDMLVPDGGGPPLHRHDFEEMFTLLEGELEFYFRGQTQTVKAPATVNIPANAPHHFKNVSGRRVHMLCMCTPAGQDEFFAAVGVPLESRDAAPPTLSHQEQQEKANLAQQLAPKYRTEFIKG
jgi:quercetin dioxygenase-like cupin family protein